MDSGSRPTAPGTPRDRLLARQAPQLNVLGSVHVTGAARHFSSSRALDVIAYLAFHRDGADAQQLRSWVWPSDAQPSDQAFANVMSRARLGLGLDPRGEPYLSRAGLTRVYRLSSTMRTDVDVANELLADAQAASSTESRVTGQLAALSLVRGRPFTGGGADSFLWADQMARAHVTCLLDETVHRCADEALDHGLFRHARAAIFAGMRLIPGCEQCHARRFRLAAAERNLTELRSAMDGLMRTVAEELGVPAQPSLLSGWLRDQWAAHCAGLNAAVDPAMCAR